MKGDCTISSDKLGSQLKERKPVREIFSHWLLTKDYKKSNPMIYHRNWGSFRMNGDAINHFAGTTGINQYCPGKHIAWFP